MKIPINSIYINKVIKYVLCFFTFWIVGLNLRSQTPNYIQYGASDNLPTREVYELMEDSRGYIWALTDRGIHRFNGEHFEEIKTENEFKTAIPIDLLEDDNQQIWFLFLDGRIANFNYTTERIIGHPMNSEIERLIAPGKISKYVLNNSFKHTSDGALIFSLTRKGFFVVYPDSVENHLNPSSSIASLISRKNNNILVNYNANLFDETEYQIHLFDKKKTFDVKHYLKEIPNANATFYVETKTAQFICLANLLLRIENDSIQNFQLFNSNILGLMELNENELLVFNVGEAPVIIDLKTLVIKRKYNLPFKSISYGMKDSEGGLWFSTLFNGIIHIPQLTFNHFKSTSTQPISALKWFNEKLYYGTIDGEIGYVGAAKRKNIITNKASKIIGFPILNEQLNVLTTTHLITLKNDTIINRFPKQDIYLNVKDFLVKNDTLYCAQNNGIIKIFDNQLYHRNQLIITEKNSLNITPEFNQSFIINSICNWKNTPLGIHKNTIQRLDYNTQPIDTVCLINEKIQQIRSNENGIFYSTKKGIFWVDSTLENWRCILATTNFLVNDLFLNKAELWAATTNGIFRIVLNTTDFSANVSSIQLGKSLHTTVTTLDIANNTLFAGTPTGIFQLPLNKLKLKQPPLKMYLKKVTNSGKKVNRKQKGIFNYEQNDLIFDLDLLNINSRRDIVIYYRLAENQEWKKTTNLKIEFVLLPPGSYKFQAKACLNGAYSAIQEYTFKIAPPFWQRIELKLGISITLILALFWYYGRRLKKVKKENETNQKIYELEKRAKKLHQQALSAQLNPHFMFNALGSIHNFILENDSITSEKYLTDFSHLMRLILESSVDEFITIDKEVKLLETYLSLEQLRFEFSFQFELICDEELLNEGLKIPAMILQPIVENAIIHGVKNNANGHIKIQLKDCQEFVSCTIIDNGKGIVATTSQKEDISATYKPRATAIIAERIEILKTDYPTTSIHYSKLNKGTQVSITLPVI